MSQWETILDRNSRISPIKIVPHKDHSAKWIDNMFREAYRLPDADIVDTTTNSQSSLLSMTEPSTPLSTKPKRKRNSWLYRTSKSLLVSSAIFFVATFSLTKYCDNINPSLTSAITESNNTINSLCHYMRSFNTDVLANSATATILHKHVLGPLAPHLQHGYQWIDSTSLNEASKQLKQYSQTKLRKHYIPLIKHYHHTYISQVLKRYVEEFKQQLKEYIESGSPQPLSGNGQFVIKETDHKKDKLRQTAKRVLDFLEEQSRKSAEAGMQKEEAREKAREIVQSLLHTESEEAANTVHAEDRSDFANSADMDIKDVDLDILVAEEIQSILDFASVEKAQLITQLNLIQAQIKDASSSALANNNNLKDTEDYTVDAAEKLTDQQRKQRYFVAALKLEVEGLRAVAENNVRKRAKLALERVEKSMQKNTDNAIIQQHIKENIQSTQKLALKDLRQTYVQLHETKKQIDQQLLLQKQ